LGAVLALEDRRRTAAVFTVAFDADFGATLRRPADFLAAGLFCPPELSCASSTPAANSVNVTANVVIRKKTGYQSQH
jgi:hypothetical protein